MPEDPVALFQSWYAEAQRHRDIVDASAMALATADAHGRPAVRMVLLKAVDARGFVFYTDLRGPKARDLADNPEAELCFHWAPLDRQVRVHGHVEAVSAAEADAYFATRPRLSQLGAWASRQSEPMPRRFALHEAVARVGMRFGVGAVPRPLHWSGFRVVPENIEFWRQRPFRQHERLRFAKTEGSWEKEWLFP